MQPEIEPTPDPVTDDEAYQELLRQLSTLQAGLWRVEEARRVQRLRREEEQEAAALKQLAEDLAARYPTPVPDEIFTLAQTTAYLGDGEDAEPQTITEHYGLIAKVVNNATAVYAQGALS